MSPEETQGVLDKYNVTRDKMPQIISADPAIKHLNAKVGDIIKIMRTNEYIGNSIYYRVVVE
ncbi:MAG: DNA-directed RNA polymerase subunit H [Candidatus Altiarchaeota archaeon]